MVNVLSAESRQTAGDLLPARAPGGSTAGAFVRPRVRTDGKLFRRGDARFQFRGVTYGTFLARESDGALFPERDRLKLDLEAMADAGFTVVRTYTTPTDDLLDLAADHGLQVMAGVFYPDWRYLLGGSRRDARRMMAEARQTVAAEASRLADHDQVLAVCLGNEVPADVIRWYGTNAVAKGIAELTEVVREIDDELLVTYANYPTAEYLPLESLDFLTFNVFLEDKTKFRRYLSRLQHLAGERPLVLGEIGLNVGDDHTEQRQADLIDWQLEVAMERGVAGTCLYAWTDDWAVGGTPVEGWQFGITRADRSPRPAVEVARTWNELTVADLRDDWPSVSVLICAYNAEDTIDECLRHTCQLDYPNLEIIVVDDGSTDATAAITRRHPRARLVQIDHAGLSVGRNAGLAAASGEIVAYLDSDAYPSPEWLYYLVLGFDGRRVAGVGGPNVPPPDDPVGAHRVARSPGGPVHVLVSDDRAEHVPGCNMAFWREVLLEVGGFDPIYTAAGDDVDVCWKVLDAGWEIGFHPGALVWHHRRPGLRAYLRQQRGYGRSEALVEARHPDRFTPTGTARWKGRIYNPVTAGVTQPRIYHGVYGTAAYQSVYQGGGHALDFAHQLGVPAAALSLPTAALFPLSPLFALPAALALLFLAALVVIDTSRAAPPRHLSTSPLAFRLSVAMHHLLQPLVRTWGRARSRPSARPEAPAEPLPGPVTTVAGAQLIPATASRDVLVPRLVAHLRGAGFRVAPPTGWEAFDVRLRGSSLVSGDVITSAHPEGAVQVRVRRRLRRVPAAVAALACAGLAFVDLPTAAGVALLAGASVARGLYQTGPHFRRVVQRAARA